MTARFPVRLQLLTLSLVPLLLILSLAAYLTLYFAEQLRTGRAWVLHTYDVMETTRMLLAELQDAETGQQSYVLTQRADFLDLYRQAVASLPGRVARLKELTTDNPGQQARLATLDQLLEVRLATLQAVVAQVGEGDAAAARARSAPEASLAASGAVRRTVADIIASEGKLLTERVEATTAAEHRMLYASMLGAALGLAACVVGVVLLLASNRRLRQAEHGLAQQGTLLQATLDHVHDGIAAFDREQRLVAFNEHFFRLLGLPQSLARIGQSLRQLQERTKGALLTALAPGPDEDATPSLPDPTFRHLLVGERTLEIYRNAMPGGGFVVSAVDVTHRLQTEAIAHQAQKMESVGQLTGGIAHDFNNILQTIASNLELIRRDLPESGQNARRLGSAIEGVDKGARLTAQLLAFSRRQPLQPQVVNLARLVRRLSDMLQRALGETIAIDTMVPPGLWNTLADPGQVESALLNLAINARDAMPSGGKLTIELANTFLDEGYAAAHAEVTAGPYVLLAVSDTGAGMTREIMGRVFEPFFTTKPEGQGTGLGLSQVYGFVKQSGGHVKLYSEPGEGTTVKIYLPRSRGVEDQAEPAPAAFVEGGTETILVVEDDPAVRAAAVETLGELGYRVLRAEHAEAALAIITGGVPVDLLFTDVVMPGPLKAPEFTRRALEILPGLAVLYTSGYTENAIVHDGRLDDGVLLLSKPYRRDELAQRVRQALARRSRPALPQPQPPAMPSAGKGLRILVVEDDALVRMSVVDMLRALGHLAEEAATGGDALIRLQGVPAIDLLITDLGLPGMSGQELARAARGLQPRLPILVATGQSADPGQMDGAARHDMVWLPKPFLPDDLARAVIRVTRPGGSAAPDEPGHRRP
ncbi:MAG: CHASE3 domain-containing protein [Geminicoccaceae bacterium]